MDFLKKLLFPNKGRNTELEANTELDISEEDIDNFLSETSVQNLSTSESIASIASLFSHIDEMDEIRREPSVDLKIGENFLRNDKEEPENQSTIDKVKPLENSPKSAHESWGLANNNTLNFETVKETTINLPESVSEIDQILIDSSQETKTQFVASSIENTTCVKHTSLNAEDPSSMENNRHELTLPTVEDSIFKEPAKDVADVEQILNYLTDELNTSQLASEMPKFINLGSEEISIIPSMNIQTPVEKTTSETQKAMYFGLGEVIAPIKNGETPEHDIINIKEDFNRDLNKEGKPRKDEKADKQDLSFYNDKNVIDLTISENEMERDDHENYKDSYPQENKLHCTTVVASKEAPIEYAAATLEKAKPNPISTNVQKHDTPSPIHVNTNNHEASNTTEFNAGKIIQTSTEAFSKENTHAQTGKAISQEINNADAELGIIHAAKKVFGNMAPKEEVNEIISISSTDDESEATNLCENREPDTISCGDIQYYTESDSQCATNNPSTSRNKNPNTVSYDKIEDKTTEYCLHCQSSSSDCPSCYPASPSYHSSDFEFISETEAEMDGLIINYKGIKNKSKSTKKRALSTVRTIEIAREQPRNSCSDENQPGPSNYNRQYPQAPDRADHVIPQGDEYLQMFERQYNISIIRYMENKSVYRHVNSTMHVEYDGLGQNLALMREIRQQNVDNQHREDAEETAKKIRDMHPRENRKRPRRF